MGTSWGWGWMVARRDSSNPTPIVLYDWTTKQPFPNNIIPADRLNPLALRFMNEFVPLPIVPEKFAAGIERVAGLYGMGKRARVVQVIPSIGGCGSTTAY